VISKMPLSMERVSGRIANMNTYELTMIAADKAAIDGVTKLVTEFVKKAKGEVNKEENWGEKTLAYQIKKHNTAHYEHMVLTLAPSEQPKLDSVLRLEESLLRYLFVRV